MLARYGKSDEDVKAGKLEDIKGKVNAEGSGKVAEELGVGEPTLLDVLEEIIKPGRDIRDTLPPPLLRADLMDINDLKEGMELTGTVRNVIDFGAFVDIGVHHDGLVHISEISDRFIKHPSEALKVGDVVRVRVIGVDPAKKRINLSMKDPNAPKAVRVQPERRNGNNNNNRNRDNKDNRANRGNFNNRPDRNGSRPERSLDDMLKALQSKFSKK